MLSLPEARRNDELVSIADSQILRWIDELNGIESTDSAARSIMAKIKEIRKEPPALQNRKAIKKLYEQLDAVQYKSDYMCVIMDRDKDYKRANNGFRVNGVKYRRLLGTNGGIKNKTIVYVSERLYPEIIRRIQNDRDPEKQLVPAKLEAYQALACSASIPVSMPNGILVVNDCETSFISDIIYLDNSESDEPKATHLTGETVSLDESDGYGMILPSLAERWGEELDLGYVPSGMNSRWSFEKGMLYTFDFVEFAEKVAGTYMVEDAWGDMVDIRTVEAVFTTSMVKLWDSYDSCSHYVECCEKNHYTIGIPKVCPDELETEHTLNYQFIQPYHLDDEDIDELVNQTMCEIKDVLVDDWRKAVLFMKGVHLNPDKVPDSAPDFAKAIMADPRIANDPFVRSKIYQQIKKRINEAKVGVLAVHGNYSMVCGDPYALCQHMCGLPVTGLLKAGEIYNQYWDAAGADNLICFRAPMTAMANIRKVTVNRSADVKHWFRYMRTCTCINAWDTIAHALNGMDKDGDLVMLTDNPVLLRRHREMPTLMCIQRRAEKKIVTEDDIITSNIASFGDDIGKITNRITTMFEIQSRFDPDSDEYRELDYRINCGQLIQQDAIDKAKGIISKPMPRSWYDRHAAVRIDDPERRALYLRILAENKPYFMRYVYPDLMRQYNNYVRNSDRKAQREFGKTISDLMSVKTEDLTLDELTFLMYYKMMLPVGTSDCVMNRICRRFEDTFDGIVKESKESLPFDYRIMKSNVGYTQNQYYSILRLFEDYNRRMQNYQIFAARERVDHDDIVPQRLMMREDFRSECDKLISNEDVLCDIVVDICYKRNATKQFAWDMVGDTIICNLIKNGSGSYSVPVLDNAGDFTFAGRTFKIVEKEAV